MKSTQSKLKANLFVLVNFSLELGISLFSYRLCIIYVYTCWGCGVKFWAKCDITLAKLAIKCKCYIILEMAFMMPVVKNDWDIYKSNRTRRVSECSNPSTCRSRKVSECRSEGPSVSTSPGSECITPTHRSVPTNMSRQYSRVSSRTSEGSLQSPIKSVSSSPPKEDSAASLNKFHNRLIDKLKKSLKCKDSCNEKTSSWDNENPNSLSETNT